MGFHPRNPSGETFIVLEIKDKTCDRERYGENSHPPRICESCDSVFGFNSRIKLFPTLLSAPVAQGPLNDHNQDVKY